MNYDSLATALRWIGKILMTFLNFMEDHGILFLVLFLVLYYGRKACEL